MIKGALIPGDLVRRFRSDAHLCQEGVARRLDRSQGLLSKWESNERAIPRAMHGRLDEIFGLGGRLEDLLLAITTPRTLEPRHRWWHNYEPGYRPVWGWIRSCGAEVQSATISWGTYGFTIEVPPGPTGIIINAPTSVANPPTLVQLEQPGWVDFGRGNVPIGIGVPVCDGQDTLDVLDQGRNETIGLVADHLRRILVTSGRTQADLAEFLRVRPALVAEVLGRAGQRGVIERLSPTRHLQPASDPNLAERLRAIRQGRGIKQREVAGLLERQPATDDLPPVTNYHIRTVEDAGVVKVDYLLERLDHLYRCDGLLARAVVGPPRVGPDLVAFPDFWVGNVWLDIDAPADRDTDFELHWGVFRRPLSLRGRTAVTMRKSLVGQEPLWVETSDDCRWRAGVGVRSDAVDINQNWKLEAGSDTKVVGELFEVLLQLAGRTSKEFCDYFSPSMPDAPERHTA